MTPQQQKTIDNIRKKLSAIKERIVFDEATHTYLVDGKEYKSVSYWQNKYKSTFDDQMANYTAIKYNKIIRKIKTNKYDESDLAYFKEKEIDINIIYNKDIIADIWNAKNKKAVDIGVNVHLFAESYPNFKKDKDKRELQVEKWFNDNFDEKRYVIIGHEIQLFSEEFGFTGTLDFVLYDLVEESLVIVDWKCNLCTHEEFENKYYDNLLLSLKHLPKTNLNFYSIQQNFYKILLEECTGIKVKDCFLIHISEESYKQFRVIDFTNSLKKDWVNHKEIKERAKETKKEEKLCEKLFSILKIEKYVFVDNTYYHGEYIQKDERTIFYIANNPKLNYMDNLVIEKDVFEKLVNNPENKKVQHISFYKNAFAGIVTLTKELFDKTKVYKRRIKSGKTVETKEVMFLLNEKKIIL